MSGLACRIDLHLRIGLRLAPIGRLAGDHLHVRILVDDVMIALGADAGIGVGLLADQFDIVALLAHQLDEFLRAELGALIVVRHDLGDGDAAGIDLAVDQECGNAGVLGLLDRSDGGVGAGIVEHDRLGLAADRGIDQLGLLVGVVVMDQDDGVVAELLGLGRGTFRLRLEERVVVRGGDDRDQVGGIGGRGCAQRHQAGHRGKCHSAREFHASPPSDKIVKRRNVVRQIR